MNGHFALGALHFGSLLTLKESQRVILHAIHCGIKLIDTAPLYGRGASEAIIGSALSGKHHDVTIATKVGLEVHKRHDGSFGVKTIPLNYSNIKYSVDQSRRNLRRDSIDLLMLHAFDSETHLCETLAALYRLYQEGSIKSFGCSNYNPRQLRHLLQKLKTNPAPPFVAAQCHYNMIERRAGHWFIPLCEKNDKTLMINRALARGALSGQYLPNTPLPQNSRAAESKRIRKWLTTERLALLGKLASLAKSHQTSLTSIALAWIMKKHSNALILIGVRSVDQLDACLQATDVIVNEPLFEKIDALIEKEPHVTHSPPRYFEK